MAVIQKFIRIVQKAMSENGAFGNQKPFSELLQSQQAGWIALARWHLEQVEKARREVLTDMMSQYPDWRKFWRLKQRRKAKGKK